MKSSDYLVIQAPMITELHLKGNSLLLFALITGFTRDQNTRFRGSLTYMCEWLNTSRSSVIRSLEELEKDGFIERHQVAVGRLKVNEYSSKYNEILEKLNVIPSVEVNSQLTPDTMGASQTSTKMTLVPKCDQYQNGTTNPQNESQSGTKTSTEMELVPKCNQYQNETKVVPKWDKTSTKMVPNNIDNIYNIYSYCNLSPEEQEEEKKGLFEYFFFRNAVDPAEEVERFVGHNTANGWMNKDGREYDTAAKRKGLASLWRFQSDEGRVPADFLKFWRQVYSAAQRNLLPGSAVLLDEKANIRQDESTVIIQCRKETMEYIEHNIDVFRPVFLSMAQGRKMQYNIK